VARRGDDAWEPATVMANAAAIRLVSKYFMAISLLLGSE
jgi:hypothetical protein